MLIYRIYSLIRRTICYKKILLFDQNLLKTLTSVSKGAKSERAKKHVLEMIDVRNNWTNS